MKKLILFLAFAGVMCGQVVNQPSSGGSGGGVTTGSSLPATCTSAASNLYFLTTGTVGLYQCLSTNTWTLVGSGTNALTVSGSIVGTGTLNMPVAGMSCGKVVLGFASLTGGVQSQEIDLFVVPANFRIDALRMNPATLYAWASGGTTMTVSVQQHGNTASPDIMPATNIMSGGVFLDDLPANPNLSSHTISLNMAGNANFSNLNAGSLQVTYCGHVVL
jgi:hypothetical protein